MAKLVSFKIKLQDPKRSLKLVVLGSPGSGRSSVARSLAEKYGFTYISTTELISDQIFKKTELGRVSQQLIMKGELIPDEIITGLLNERLNQSDCQICGFVLDGYPKNLVQLNCMNDLKIQPTAIVILDCPEDLMMERIESRMIDSVTGKIYNKSSIPSNNEIKSRLVKVPNESREVLQKRFKRWKEVEMKVSSKYNPVLIKVSTKNTLNNVVNQISVNLERKVL